MYKYQIHYIADDETRADEGVEARSAERVMEITVDHEIATAEEITEIARSIGHNGGFTSVKIQNIVPGALVPESFLKPKED